jgi:hypothetical protein
MATLLKVLNNLADIKSAGGVAPRVRTQGRPSIAALTRAGERKASDSVMRIERYVFFSRAAMDSMVRLESLISPSCQQ